MSDTIQHRIDVKAQSFYIPQQSIPEQKRFTFAYTITISNTGAVPARLVSRHWVITDANGAVQEVRGAGVVGETPYLKPGEAFEYTSGTVIETEVGVMEGSYQMVAEDGHEFNAEIAPFRLSIPGTLH